MRRLLMSLFLAVLSMCAVPWPAHAGNVTCALVRRSYLSGASGMLVFVNVTMSTSYATGGDTFSTANVLADVSNCLCGDPHYKPVSLSTASNVQGNASPATSVDLFRFDTTANKIQAFTVPGTEVTSTTNLSGFILSFQTLCI